MCLYPRIIKNPKYKPNIKNKGIIPDYNDNRVLAIPVGCGKCMECLKKKSREWQVRLYEDIRHNKNAKYITLTFSNESIKELNGAIGNETGYEKDNAIAKKGVKRFLERWRKEYKKSIRHWLVTELGHNGTENIHLHGIIWTNESNEQISKHWKYGGITIGERLYINGIKQNNKSEGYVNEKTINYITKYINKTEKIHKNYKSIILTSAGIGKGYTERIDAEKNKYKEKGETNETYRTRTGHKIAMPMYYRNKIYTDEEREKLWIEKLDKEIRWINGVKIDISENNTKYFKALQEARGKNKMLGYGTSEKEWSRIEYENNRRELLISKRIANASIVINRENEKIFSINNNENKKNVHLPQIEPKDAF